MYDSTNFQTFSNTFRFRFRSAQTAINEKLSSKPFAFYDTNPPHIFISTHTQTQQNTKHNIILASIITLWKRARGHSTDFNYRIVSWFCGRISSYASSDGKVVIKN